MKKFSLSLLVALCGFTLSAETPAPAPAAAETAKPAAEAVKPAEEAAKPAAGVPGKVAVRSGNLRFRLEPTQKSPVAVKLANGAEVRVLAVRGNWVEVAAPESTPVYVSEAYISGGRTIRELNLRSKRDSASAVIAVLPKGAEVKLLGERSHGWVRVAPPRDLKLYAVKFYIQFDEAAVKAMQSEAKPAAAAPAPAKSEAKPAAKPAAAAPAPAKSEAKPAAKPAEAAPAPAKSEAKPAAKPAEAAPAPAKSEAKPAAKPAAALPVPKKIMAELHELGVPADAKPVRFEQTGTLVRVAGSQSRTTDHALMFENENRGFVAPIADGILRKEFVDQPVRVVGRAYRIPTWKAPIVVVESMARL